MDSIDEARYSLIPKSLETGSGGSHATKAPPPTRTDCSAYTDTRGYVSGIVEDFSSWRHDGSVIMEPKRSVNLSIGAPVGQSTGNDSKDKTRALIPQSLEFKGSL